MPEPNKKLRKKIMRTFSFCCHCRVSRISFPFIVTPNENFTTFFILFFVVAKLRRKRKTIDMQIGSQMYSCYSLKRDNR